MNNDTIKRLYKKYAVPRHITLHMKKVARVALFLAKEINRKAGRRLVKNRTVSHAALLHDILKVCEFKKDDELFNEPKYDNKSKRIWHALIKKYGPTGHIRAAEDLLNKLNEPELARIIKKHEHSSLIAPKPASRPRTLEEKIIYYADKRVLHDRIVPMTFRFKEGRIRYLGKSPKMASQEKIMRLARNLQKELCEKAGISPSDLPHLVR